jgi:hypothetical protein
MFFPNYMSFGAINHANPCPADAQRAPAVDQRGDQGMGFSHPMTGHHFRLYPDGGAVEVESNRLDDDATKAAIRRQMHKIAGMFAQGDFSLPVFIHDTVPAGVVINEAFKGSNRVYSREYRQRR